VYLPDDPRVNRLVSAESSSAADATGGLVLGVLLLGGGALWLGWMIGRHLLMPHAGVPSEGPLAASRSGGG
jgi:hypothetical protein